MKLKPYPAYKVSGVDWLGNLPKEWKVNPLKHHFKIVGGSTPKSDQEEYWDGDITWVTPSDLSKLSSFSINNSQRKITPAGLSSCGSTLVPAGSIILSTRAPIGSIAITDEELCTNQGCKSLVPDTETNSMFYTYLLSVSSVELNARGKGTTFLELSGDELSAFKVGFPSLQEQCSIVRFLDRETGKLDTLILKQEHLIELLQEKRQAIISHAVTKGLNPDVTMKDSGVKWLGMVPSSWSLIPFKYIVTLAGRIGFRGYTTEDLVEDGEGAITLSPSNLINGQVITDKCTYISWHKYNESPEIQVKYGDVIMVKTGSTYGKVAMVRNPNMLPSTINPQLVIFKNIQCDKTFLYYLLSSTRVQAEIEVSNTGSTIPTMTQETIGNIRIALPTSSEQVNISIYLDYETAKIDILIDKAKRSIELAKEHRSALISAAVTGKIDVREAA